jgi:hypothetical protein
MKRPAKSGFEIVWQNVALLLIIVVVAIAAAWIGRL